jgi:hypothetical protein
MYLVCHWYLPPCNEHACAPKHAFTK